MLALCHLLLFLICLDFADCVQSVKTTKCDFLNETQGSSVNPGFPRTETCDISQPQRTHCFVLWHVNSGEAKVVMKGCWVGRPDCNNQTKCVPRPTPNTDQMYFCCCEGDFCNRNITVSRFPEAPPSTTVSTSTPIMHRPDLTFQTIQYTIFPMLALFLIIPICYLYRARKAARSNHMPLPTTEPPAPPKQGLQGTIVLDRHRARGRFGEVHSAFYHKTDGSVLKVAVKIFQLQERKSWLLEQNFFNQFDVIQHQNVLRFYGAEEHRTHDLHQLWLVTDYHERGSLYDYLKGNLVSWQELLLLCEGMARGLEFLHDAETHGPAVAHRDFKSKNVLIKDDMSACVADFGLSLRFDQCAGQVHGQVGTRRYMAPEVLDGAINFNCHDFLCIDMYAMGLVMWEVLSRCSSIDGPVAEYQLPFEDEVGLHPTLEDMQDLVVRRKQRPIIKEHWKNNQLGSSTLCSTIEECWDQDAEARLSASTVVQRLERFPRSDPKVQNNINNTTSHHGNTGGGGGPPTTPTINGVLPSNNTSNMVNLNIENESTGGKPLPVVGNPCNNRSPCWPQPLTASQA